MPIEGVGTATLLTRPSASTSSNSENRETASTNSGGTASQTSGESRVEIPPTPTEGATQEGNSEGASNFNSSANAVDTSADVESSENGSSQQRVDLTV